MRLTAQVKLHTTPEQIALLLKTLEQCNAACTWISEQAWQHKVFGQFKLHKLVYYAARERFGLNSSLVVRCIAKVADAYKLDKKSLHTFQHHGSIALDHNLLRWHVAPKRVSLAANMQRLKLTFQCGEHQMNLLQRQHGESDLVYDRGAFYLFAPCLVDDVDPVQIEDTLGIDLGITTIATDSDGTIYGGNHLKSVRYRHRRLRRNLQKKGTLSCKRRLQHLAGKEQRFAQNTNHCISKQIVKKAQDTQRAIVLENLKHIRSRMTATKAQRIHMQSWSFSQLRQYIEYKAQRVGIPVQVVDPRNTSRTGPQCGCIDKRNRPNQKTFTCIACGYAAHADMNAAVVIGSRGAVNHPHVSAMVHPVRTVVPETSRRLVSGGR